MCIWFSPPKLNIILDNHKAIGIVIYLMLGIVNIQRIVWALISWKIK